MEGEEAGEGEWEVVHVFLARKHDGRGNDDDALRFSFVLFSRFLLFSLLLFHILK